MTAAVTAALGVAIGVTLGALGGGGSVLAVPALVYMLGQSAQDATTASLVIVGTTSAISALSYTRDRHVRWRAGLTFGVVGVGASYLGTILNHAVPGPVLLVSFAALMLVTSAAMLFGNTQRTARTPSGDRSQEMVAAGSGPSGSTAPTDRPASTASAPRRIDRSATVTALGVVVAGLVVGFLTGFLGVGGGFIVVPALVLLFGYQMPLAVGTSLLIIALNSGVSLIARVGHNDFDWAVIVPFTVAAVAGSLAGKQIANRIPSRVLGRCFAVLLAVVAAYMAFEASLTLA